MGRFSQVLFVSDFDHTLSDMSGAVPKRNLEAVRRFMEEGGIFTVASGRSIPMFRQKAKLVPVNAPCILYNGAACYDYHTDTLEHTVALPESAERFLADLILQYPQVRFEVQGTQAHYAIGEDAFRDRLLREAQTPVIYPQAKIPRPWLKIAAYGRFTAEKYEDPASVSAEELCFWDGLRRYAEEKSAGKYSVARSMARIVDIWAAECDKGTAARALARRLGRPVLVCIGDAPNDTAMLKEADIAFCPADCDPEIQAMGLMQVAPSAQGSVADAMERLDSLL